MPTPADREFRGWSEVGDWLFVPRGLLPDVLHLVPSLRGRVRDRRLKRPDVDWHWQGSLFDYQRQALATIRRQGGGTLISPPGSGKTEVALAFAAEMRQPAAFLVNSLDLADQALARARKLFALDDSAYSLVCKDTRSESGRYPAGSHLIVATTETLAKYPALAGAVGLRCGTVIVDEAHHLPAQSVIDILKHCPGRYRLVVTATDDRGDGLGPVIPAVAGPRYEIPVSTLVRAGRLVLPRVEIVYTDFPGTPAAGWDRFQAARARHPRRNALVVRLAAAAAQRGRRVIVVVELVEHAALLARFLREAGVPCSALDGSEDRERRSRLLRALRARRGCALVATKLMDEGIDIPEADCLVLAAPGRSPLRLRQQVGRVMRSCPGKHDAVVYDLADIGSLSLQLQLSERLDTYRHFGDVDLHPRRYLGVA